MVPINITYSQIGCISDTCNKDYTKLVYETIVDTPDREVSPLTWFIVPVFVEARENFLHEFTHQIRSVGYELNNIDTYDVKTQPHIDKPIEILDILIEA